MSDKIRKYLIPNLPYALVFWLSCKLGEAYRLAVGTDFTQKFLGSINTINKVFANPLPSFNMNDWAVGLCGAMMFISRRKMPRNIEKMWNMARRNGEVRSISSLTWTLLQKTMLFYLKLKV